MARARGGRHGEKRHGQIKEHWEDKSQRAGRGKVKAQHERQRVHAPVFVSRVPA